MLTLCQLKLGASSRGQRTENGKSAHKLSSVRPRESGDPAAFAEEIGCLLAGELYGLGSWVTATFTAPMASAITRNVRIEFDAGETHTVHRSIDPHAVTDPLKLGECGGDFHSGIIGERREIDHGLVGQCFLAGITATRGGPEQTEGSLRLNRKRNLGEAQDLAIRSSAWACPRCTASVPKLNQLFFRGPSRAGK